MAETNVYAFILNFVRLVYVFAFKFKNSSSSNITEILTKFIGVNNKQHLKSEKKNNNKETFFAE